MVARVWMLLGAVCFCCLGTVAFAQGGGQGQGQNNGPPIAGIEINAGGRARIVQFDARLMAKRVAAQKAALDPVLARPSESRKISLNRLEQLVAERLQQRLPITDEINYLAGLTGIDHVFYFPDTQDVVIAGPAEGFVVDPSGRPVGMQTGRCVLELQDLIVALRSFPPSGQAADLITVSIDPTAEGLARFKKAYRDILGRAGPQDGELVALSLRDALGEQLVSIRGVSPRTHFAHVLLEADYRMKLIGIGLEIPSVKIKSYVERANGSQIAKNALERWYFTTHFDEVRVSEDHFAMQLVGSAVRLVGAHELVSGDGNRRDAGKINAASQAFCKQFSEKFPELAARSPVYGQLQNLVSMAVAAAYIREHDFYSLANWKLETFGDEASMPVETFPAPERVDTAVNVLWRDNGFLTPLGGGVSVRPKDALAPDRLRVHADLHNFRGTIKTPEVAKNRWWWD